VAAGIDRLGRAQHPVQRVEIVDHQVDHRAAALVRVVKPLRPARRLRQARSDGRSGGDPVYFEMASA
jgi:hypothetical protein